MLYLKLALIFLISSLGFAAADVESISECPKLSPRTAKAKDVTDLRIDDIEVVAALGDSIMAGFGIMGINNGEGGNGVLNISIIREYRGNSYAIGGDKDAVTLASFAKHYNPDITGASVLSRFSTLCYGPICSHPMKKYHPKKDIFNAALSGAMAMNLDNELDYLITQMKSKLSSKYPNLWKMITIQIGSNDQCASCTSSFKKYTTPEAYGKYVEAAIIRIQKEMPNTVVNLLGSFKVSGLSPLTSGEVDYCKRHLLLTNDKECSCFASKKNLKENLKNMDEIVDGYNKQLESIAKKYSGKSGEKFAVMYSPAPIDMSTFSIDALSNLDCFHPSLKGHQWIAKTFWNQLFTKKEMKPSVLNYDPNLKIRCPTEDDRLPNN